MQRGGLIRSTGFGPAESFVGSVSPSFDRRGAHPAWSLAACFTLPGAPAAPARLPRSCPNLTRVRRAAFRPARFSPSVSSCRLIANDSLLPRLSIRNSIATRDAQHTKFATPRAIIAPESLDLTDAVYRKKVRLLVAKFGAFMHQYLVSLYWLTTRTNAPTPIRSRVPDPSPSPPNRARLRHARARPPGDHARHCRSAAAHQRLRRQQARD